MRISPFTLFLAGLCVVLSPQMSYAADEEEAFVVAYRMSKPATMEFEDPAKAKAHVAALAKLGCKSKSEAHDGHTDVTYQQVRWTIATFNSEELVHKWQDWLTDAGFETLHSEDPEHEAEHEHAHEHEGVETIEFKTKDWVTKHFEDAATGAEFVVVCKALGCEFKEDTHDGHPDIQYRCLKPRHIECPNHEAAEARAEWLTKLEFIVKHDH